MDRSEVFEKIYETYCEWYDMERSGEEKTPLCATGSFHSTDSAYVLMEKATMWTADSNDYLYIFNMDSLDEAQFRTLIETAKTMGEQHINPQKNHKCSYVTALFLCNQADPAAVDALKKYRFRKNFSFGFKGWEEVHTALFAVNDGSIYSNRDGSNTAKFLSQIFFPKKKGLLHKIKGV